MKKPTVLLDCDGVLADFIGGALRIVREVTGLEYAAIDVTEFDFCKALGLDAEQKRYTLGSISSRAGFCRSLLPHPEALEGVRRLRELARIYVVTSPWNSNATWMSEREAWLDHYFDIPHGRVIHASAKHLVWGDFFVDDKPETIMQWQAAWPAGTAVLWDAPYNRQSPALRAATWDEIVALVGAVGDAPKVVVAQPDPPSLSPVERGLTELAEAVPSERPRVTFLDFDTGGES